MLDPLTHPLPPFALDRISKETGEAQARYVKEAVQLALNENIAGIVTAPINKEAINLAGYPYPGHTEFLADLTGAKEAGMMIVGGRLRFMFTTTHVAMKDLASRLTIETVERAIRLCHHHRVHLLSGSDVDTADPSRATQRGRAGNQRDLGAGISAGTRQRIAHLSAGTVSNVTHRVYRLTRWPGSN